MPDSQRISPEQVVDRILDMTAAIPESKEGLPPEAVTAGFWRELLNLNERTRRILAVLQELPAFTNMAPAPGDAAGWRAVFEKDFAGPPVTRPNTAAQIVQAILSAGKERPPVRTGPYWRDRFGPDEVIQRVRPAESDEYIPNPHRGTATFQRFQGDDTYAAWTTSDTHGPLSFAPEAPVRDNVKYIPRTTVAYCRWPWRWLEPKKGTFRWDLVEQALATAHNRGQTLQVRFQPYTQRVNYATDPCPSKRHPPERSVNVPDWYWDTGAAWTAQGVYAPNEPDSKDPLYVKHFGDLIRAFARRFDGHADLESVDMAYAGFWGECGGNSTPATAAKLVDIYLKSFKKTQLLSMHGTPGCAHAARATRASRRAIGWRHDCIGDLRKAYGYPVPPELSWNSYHDDLPPGLARCGIEDAWRKAPVTMETCGNVATWFMEGFDLDTIIREGYRYHTSIFMPKSVFFPSEFLPALIEFDKKIGYRFVLRQMVMPLEGRPGGKIKLTFFIDNVGCAPIYRPYTLAIRFRQGEQSKVVRLKADIRTWMPGHRYFEEQLTVPRGLAKGEAKVDLAITDKNGKPRVWFAVKCPRTSDGWHELTSMDVV
ncbi:MAG: DUF4832 domain-containing protein [Phycisphaerae bacterium]